MYNCRCRKCCSNSMCSNDSNLFENIIQDVLDNNDDCPCRKANCCNNSNCQKCNMNNCPCNRGMDDDCECGYIEDKKESVFPENPVLGQSYVPIQTMGKTYIPSVGLKMGTIYPELVMPYKPCQSLEDIAFIKAMNTVKEGCNKC